MKFFKLNIVLFLFLSWNTQFVMSQYELSIKFYDKSSLIELDSVDLNIKIGSETFFKNNNYSGEYLEFDEKDITIKVTANKDMYFPINEKVTLDSIFTRKRRNQAKEISFYLSFEGQLVEGVTIDGESLPDTVFGSDKYSVADFEIDNFGHIYAMIYPKTLKKGAYLVKIVDGETVKQYKIPFFPEEMTRDYAGNIYVLGDEQCWRLVVDEDDFLLSKMDRDLFDKQIAPIVDTIQDEVIYTTYAEHYPAFECMRASKVDSTYQELYYIEDEEMMEHYRAEYKFSNIRTRLWAWDMERATDIDKEVWVGANVFTQSIYYEPPYAPVFVKDDTVLVFDHYKDELVKIEPMTGESCGKNTISYHTPRRNDWDNLLLQDIISKNVFVVFDHAGYKSIAALDLSTGELSNRFDLHFRYVEKIRIFEGEVFYIYRPYESLQKKFIYKEKLEFRN